MSSFFRNATGATCLLLVLALLGRTTKARAQTQGDVTRGAVNFFDSLSRNWDVYLDRYMVTGAGSAPQYDASHVAWGQAYHTEIRLSQYEIGGDVADLEYVLDQMDLLNSHRADRLSPSLRDELRGGSPPAWISFNQNQGSQAKQHAWLVHTGRAVHPAARAAAVVRRSPQLESVYGQQVASMLPDIIESLDMFESEYSVNAEGGGVYGDPYLEFYTGEFELPFNMQNAAGRAFVALWQATGEPRFRQRAGELAIHMKNELVEVGDKYTWRYASYRPLHHSEDVIHGAMNVNFMIDAYEAGLVFDDTDMQRLSNTMKSMYRADEGFTGFVDGEGETHVGNSDDVAGWLRLTNYDGELRKQVYPYFESYWTENPGDIDSILAASYLIGSGSVYEAVIAAEDSFNQSQLSRRWIRPSDQPLDHVWTTEMADGKFQITDIGATGSGEWVTITRKQSVERGGYSWQADINVEWDSSDDTNEQVAATQRFFLNLYDETDSLVGKIGINDEWTDGYGQRIVQIGDDQIIDVAGGLAPDGEASLRIISDRQLNQTTVMWGEDSLLQTVGAIGIGSIELEVAHLQQDDSHFGSVSLDNFYFGSIRRADQGRISIVPETGLAAAFAMDREAETSLLPEPSSQTLTLMSWLFLLSLRRKE